VVPDTALDARFADNPIIRPPHNLRFYAGALLVTPQGQPLGTLCVLDSAPRPDGLSEAQTEALQALARQVMTTMELRRVLADKSRAEAALAAAFQTNADILSSIDDPFFVLDGEFDIVFANSALARMIDAPRDLVGQNLLRLLSYVPDYAASPGMSLMRQVMRERVSVRLEMFSVVLDQSWVDVAIYPISNGGIAVYAKNIAKRKQLEAELEAALKTVREQLAEKELLMLETHHRVKNSLTMVQSLLTLQARNIKDPDIARKVAESAARVRIFGALHETLYRIADGTHVDMAAYLETLIADLNAGIGATLEGRPIRLQVDRLRWPSADVSVVGLVLTELVTNALKYGSGVVDVELRGDPGNGRDATLRVSDEGSSLPQDFNPSQTNGLGMRLISRLVRDRGGRVEIDRTAPGTSFVVTLSAQAPAG
jgi:two-component sensor histidine kinase